RDPAPGAQPGAQRPARDGGARAHAAGSGVRRPRGSARPAHGAGAGALPGGAGAGLARRGPLRPGAGPSHRLGRQPAWIDRPRTLRARARLACRSRLPDARRHPCRGSRRAAPPRPAKLRGTGRGLGWRPPGVGAARTGAAAMGGPALRDPGAAGDGIVPRLEELVALRHEAPRMDTPGIGRAGMRGAAPSSLRGRGMEYAESREYVPGDDVRRMDWRLTARTGRAHTKLFQAERERPALLVADTSPALYFGTRVRFKSVQAARAGAVATW